jgi:hypothetical protein
MGLVCYIGVAVYAPDIVFIMNGLLTVHHGYPEPALRIVLPGMTGYAVL